MRASRSVPPCLLALATLPACIVHIDHADRDETATAVLVTKSERVAAEMKAGEVLAVLVPCRKLTVVPKASGEVDVAARITATGRTDAHARENLARHQLTTSRSGDTVTLSVSGWTTVRSRRREDVRTEPDVELEVSVPLGVRVVTR